MKKMHLNQVIKNILDGNAIIIMGAGASLGATNSLGHPFPSGYKLASSLFEACNEKNYDPNDLKEASQLFEETFSPRKLINEIRTQLSVGKIETFHETIYSLPWIRYYTTNYDEVALFACKKQEKNITPITLDDDFQKHRSEENICVHINGYIGSLSEKTLHTEFKLTVESYLSAENIATSQWGALLLEDMTVAKNIVIIGLSLQHDLDLSRLFYNNITAIKDKTIFIEHADLNSSQQRKLERFGIVYKIGMEGFAEKIVDIKSVYSPNKKSYDFHDYYCFEHEYRKEYPLVAPSAEKIFNFYMNGEFSDELTYEITNTYDSVVYRDNIREILKGINESKKVIFLHSRLGNGKTTTINLLRHQMSRMDIHVFLFKENYYAKLAVDVAAICNITGKVIVIIEDYFAHTEVINKFRAYDTSNITFLFSARTAINDTKKFEIIDKLNIRENESIEIDLNKLCNNEITQCQKIFTTNGFWGRESTKSDAEKEGILKNKKRGDREFQTILIDTIKSSDMMNKINDIVKCLENESKNYYDTLILSLLSQIMRLGVSTSDICSVVGFNVFNDTKFNANPTVKELLLVDSIEYKPRIKSSITSMLIINQIKDMEIIVSCLIKVAKYAANYSSTEKFKNILINIISFSLINSFTKDFPKPKKNKFLIQYYEGLSKLPCYCKNNFFWLQYAIACIELQHFDRAQKYLDNAYGFVPQGDKFEPFQINNQQARLYMEKILNDESTDVLKDLSDAHKLLMMPIAAQKDREEIVVRLFGYYCKKEFIKKINTTNMTFFKDCCKEAHNRIENFKKMKPSVGNQYQELQQKLLEIALR